MNDEQKSMIEKETYDLERYWQRRNAQIMIDRNIINLIKPEAKSDQSNWITNEPKVFFDTARSLISINEPRFRLPIPMNFSPEQKQKMNKAERLCIGIWRTLNQRQIDRGGVSWLWDLAYYVLGGWYSVFSVAQKDKQSVKFLADLYDPMTVYPQWDSNELIRCIRTYEVDRVTAITMAENLISQMGEGQFTEPTDDGTKPKIVNYWRKRYVKDKAIVENAILISGQVVKPLTIQKKLDHIPIHVGAIGYPDRIMDDWMTRQGESIVAANRDMYDYTNIIMRLMVEIMAETAYPNIISQTRTGQPAIKDGQLTGHGAIIPVKLEDKIELLKHAATPAEVAVLFQYFNQQKAKGSVSDTVYGQIPVELSGFAISQLMAAIKYKLGMYLNSLQSITSRVMTDFLYQFKTGKYGTLTLSTTNPYDIKRGMTYLEEFTPDDVPERIFVEVNIPISSQSDKTQAILNSVQALQSGLLSRETLWETELDIQDSEQEKERIREDQVQQDPFIKDVEIIEKMWDKQKLYEFKAQAGDITAQAKADALKQYIMQKEMSLGVRKAVPQTANQGISPQQAPPEMTMSPNPDQMNAMVGKPPSGISRRTQTSEERAASKGRRGVLVSPSGQDLL
jgi:hypothetical protein